MNEVAEGFAALSGQLKEALNRVTSARPKRTSKSGYEVIRTKIDSGACEPVIDAETACDYPLEGTDASRRGIAYISASGDAMPNHGARHLVVRRPSGKLAAMSNNVTNCAGPLTAVTKTVDANNLVAFSPFGSFIMDLSDNSIDWLERVEDGYELELEVLPYSEAKPLLAAQKQQQEQQQLGGQRRPR